VLTLCAVAILLGCRSLFAVAEFGRDRGKAFAAALGLVLMLASILALRLSSSDSFLRGLLGQ
jgi:hypothetical protein